MADIFDTLALAKGGESDDLFGKVQSYQALAAEVAKAEGIDPELFSRVITQESGWNPKAKSPKGAMGLAQLMPDTAKAYTDDPYEPVENLTGGAKELASHMKKYKGDVQKALIAYNWGQGNLDKYLAKNKEVNVADLPEETQTYLSKILAEDVNRNIELTGGEVGLETRSQEEVEQAEAQAMEEQYGLPARLGHTALTGGGAVLGGLGGLSVGGGPLSPASAVTVPAGSAIGYGMGESIAQGLGLAPETGTVEQLGEAAKVGAGTFVGMRGGPILGPAGFAAANQTATVALEELKKRMGLPYDPDATIEGRSGGGKLMLKETPGGRAIEALSTDALLDLATRGVSVGVQAYAGRRHAMKKGKEAIEETERFATEEAVPEAQETLRTIERIQRKAAEEAAGVPEKVQEIVRRELEEEVAGASYRKLLGPHATTKVEIDPVDMGVITPAQSAQRERIAQAYFQPKRRIQEELGAKYEALLADKAKESIDAGTFRTRISDRIASLKEQDRWGGLPKATREYLEDLAGLGSDIVDLPPGTDLSMFPSDSDIMKAIVKQVSKPGKATVQDILSARSRGARIVAEGRTASEQAVGHEIVDAALETLNASGIDTPALKELNRSYADYYKLFRKTTAKVARGFDVEDWGKSVFGEPEVAIRVWDAAAKHPQERASLREALATYVLSQSDKGKTLKAIGEPTLKRYFGDTPLKEARIWLDFDQNVDKFSAMLAQSPEAQQRYIAEVGKRVESIKAQEGEKLVDKALGLAKKLDRGPEFNAKLHNAGAPAKQAEVAAEFIDSINPDAVAEAYRSGEVGVKHAAKILSSLPTGAYAEAVRNRLLYGSLLLGMQTFGGQGGGALAKTSIAYGVLVYGPAKLKQNFILSLRDPAKAQEFIRAVKSQKYENVARVVGDSLAATFAQNPAGFGKKATEDTDPKASPLEPPPPEATPTPLRY